MKLAEVTRLSISSLHAHLFRTVLTMLGMVIGVFSVIVLISLGQGAKNYLLSEFQSLGTNMIIVQPGRTNARTKMGPPVGASQRKMTVADVVALEKRALNLKAVSGLIFASATIRFEESVNNISVFGCNEQFPQIFNMPMAMGDFFGREEDEYGRRVVVLGHNVKRYLFGDDVAIGRPVKINGSEFRVIGVLDRVGEKLGFNLDDFAMMPTNAALRLFNEDKLFGIRAKASSRVGLDDAVAEMTEILKERRDGEEDFTIVTQVSIMDSMERLLGMLSYMLGGIATISMLVGGIGIMNIMLVSVAERTQEIGIRRAVGARRRDILTQFLSEAVLLSVFSGIIGIIGALLLTYSLYWFFPLFDMRPTWWILTPAFLLSVSVGVVFGVWPARRASKIETLDALRHE